MDQRRYSIVLLVASLLWLMTPGTARASDESIAPQQTLPSRLPLLDESGLDKYGRSSMEESLGADIDKEYPPNALIPLETKNLRYFSYFAKIQRRIEQSYYYPKEAGQDMLYGTTVVSFEIKRNGSLGKIKIISSSGKEILDDAAVSIIQKAAPFSSVPSRIRHDPLTVVTHLSFIPSQEAVERKRGLDLLSIPLK